MQETTHLPVVSAEVMRKLVPLCGQGNPYTTNEVEQTEDRVVDLYISNQYREINEAAWKYLTPASKNALIIDEPFAKRVNKDELEYETRYSETLTYYQKAIILNKLINDRPTYWPLTVYRGVQEYSLRKQSGFTAPVFFRGIEKVPARPTYKGVAVNFYDSVLQPGSVLPFYGFLSTTLSPSYAVAIATDGTNHPGESMRGGEVTSRGFLLQFELPPGFPLRYTNARGEYECILPYAKTFRYNNRKAYPLWLVAKRDTIRVRYRKPATEMSDRGAWKDDTVPPTYVTIQRVLLKAIPWTEEKHAFVSVKF